MSRVQPFRADVQGLRALAIIPVVFYHAAERWVPGGFAGVDVFFVISGFLITRILLRELELGTFSIARFYERRIRRLFPALFTMLSASLLAGFLLLPPSQLAELSRGTVWTALFGANIHMQRTYGYFTEPAEFRPLLHAWSIGVEEQFYIAFPLFLAVVSRFFGRWLKPLLWGGGVVSFAWCLWYLEASPISAFALPQARAYELVIGALLAAGAVPRTSSARVLDALSLAGLAMILASFFAIDLTTPWPGAAALLPCAGTALVIYAGEERPSVGGRLISHPVLVSVGALSYSLYLWHWPVLVFARYVVLGPLGPATLLAALALSLLLAWLSFRFIEQPVLRAPLRGRTLLLGGGTAVISATLAGVAVAGLDGLPHRFDDRSLRLFAANQDFNPRRAACHHQVTRRTDYAQSCRFGTSGVLPSVAVWADSFGAEIVVALGERLAQEGGSVLQLTASGCPPFSSSSSSASYSSWALSLCISHNDEVLGALVRDHAIETVVLAAHYHGYGSSRDRLLAGLGGAADRLHAAGKRLVLVYPVPPPGFNVPEALGLLAARGFNPARFGPARAEVSALDTPVVAVLDAIARRTGAAKIQPALALCTRPHCPAIGPSGEALYFDNKHLSIAGARLIFARQPNRWRWGLRREPAHPARPSAFHPKMRAGESTQTVAE